ncbi:MAG: hypothetical protein K0R27_3091 [Xanthobacteraceae bacterium]|jgi:hypothetical protein|nr:hypothetical protein [Xanthobacteraceae bacterium]
MIRETIISTRSADGKPHLAPLGATVIEGGYLLQPFRPSRTLDNLLATRVACINFTDDVRIFAALVSRNRQLPVPLAKATRIDCQRIAATLAHQELEVDRIEEDEQRPRFFCRIAHSEMHRPFMGLNRAKAAVIEGAVLVSRLSMLPPEKIDREMAYLAVAVQKTAGPEEKEAWDWLVEAVAAHRQAKAS